MESIAHAISLVGLRSLQAMALAAAVIEQFKISDPARSLPTRPTGATVWPSPVRPGPGAQGQAGG